MTIAADQKMSEKEQKAADLKARGAAIEAEEKKLNEGKTGKGTRTAIGFSRGRNPVKVVYEAFDESQPDTLPTTFEEFMAVSKVDDEKLIVSYLIDGYNSASYAAASDPISEFVESSWADDAQKQFRLVVRNYATATSMSLEDAVALIKPGFVAAAAKAEAAKTETKS